MNIALGGVFLLVLFLPGVIFRSVLIKSNGFENPLDTSRLVEVSFVILTSIIIHSLGCMAVEYYLEYTIYYDQIYYLLIGSGTAITKIDFHGIITPSMGLFVKYIIGVILAAGLVASILNKIILKLYLDLLPIPIFAISNEWDNILSGRIFSYNDINSLVQKEIANAKVPRWKKKYAFIKSCFHYEKPDAIQVDVLVKGTTRDIIYQGIVGDYYLSKNNTLDKLHLLHPVRIERRPRKYNNRNFQDQKTITKIPSETLVIESKHILNVNITRIWLVDDPNGE